MIDVTELEYASPAMALPGSILIRAAKARHYAAIMMIGGGGARNALTIDGGDRGFRVVNAHGGRQPHLRLRNPRFVVDPSSTLNGSDSSPEPGTLFISPTGMGIVAMADHTEVGAMLDGTLIADIDYAAFAGFRHWRLEVGDPDGDPHVLFTYRDPALDMPA